MYEYEGSTMLARWPGLATKALCSASTVPPTPTFSPSFVQFEEIPAARLPLCEMEPTLAMCWAHAWAWAVSSPDTCRGARPRPARVPLILATNSPAEAAPAGAVEVAVRVVTATTTASRAAAVRERRRVREALGATQSHRPRRGCFECGRVARFPAREPGPHRRGPPGRRGGPDQPGGLDDLRRPAGAGRRRTWRVGRAGARAGRPHRHRGRQQPVL